MAHRLKVLHFISTSVRSPYLSAIADHSDRTRFDVMMATLAPAGPLQDDIRARGLHTFALGCTRRSHYPAAVLRLAARLRRQQIDVIQTHLFDACFVGLLAARLAGTPLAVFTGHHSLEIPLYRKRLPLWIDCLCSRWLSHCVLAPSRHVRDGLAKHEAVPDDKIAVIPYGFDLTRWQSSALAAQRVRSDLGLNGRLVFGAAGRLQWIKDYPSLLKAFAPIAAERPDLALLVVGDGPDREALHRLASDLSISDRVVFAGYRTDIVDVLAAVDVFVHSSLTETFGQVIVEALALGKPVVSTDVGISREIIENGLTGFLVPPGDTPALRNAMDAALAARNDWEQMGREGQRRVQQFAAEKVVPAYEARYLAWLTERSRRSGLHATA